MYINNLISLQNTAYSPRYSTITLQDRIHAVVINSVFSDNSALVGGAMIALGKCQVTLTNCTFSSNKAITGKKLNISSKILNLKRISNTLEQNCTRTFTSLTHSLCNQTSLCDKNPKVIVTHLLLKNPILKDNFIEQKYGVGGAILIKEQSQLLMKKCVFEDNSAQYGGAITATENVIVYVHETTFVSNKAFSNGGAITIQNQGYLRMTNSEFDDNISEGSGGAISATFNTTLHAQETTFISNHAQYAGAIGAFVKAKLFLEETTFVGNNVPCDGGAINIQQKAYLRMTNCLFDDNISEQLGGAIAATVNTTLEIQDTNFTHNIALQGGAIDIDRSPFLRVTDCQFENNHVEHLLTGLGGAIYAGHGITVEIQGTSFTGNNVWQRGAIEVDLLSYLWVTNCTFENNSAVSIAGAIYDGSKAVLEINGSYFSNNSADEGGAMNIQMQSNLSLNYCTFNYNSATVDGGAILVMSNVKLKVGKTNFTDNSAARLGGALLTDTEAECHIEWSVFNRNAAKTKAGGAVYVVSNSSLQLENTNFINNNAADGGAIYIQDNSNLQTNTCSFSKNFAKQDGGAIALKGFSTTVVESSHFLSNHAVDGGALCGNDPEHVSVHNTSLLGNVASSTGGAETDKSYHFVGANQQKAGIKSFSGTQCDFNVNRCDWCILAGNEK